MSLEFCSLYSFSSCVHAPKPKKMKPNSKRLIEIFELIKAGTKPLVEIIHPNDEGFDKGFHAHATHFELDQHYPDEEFPLFKITLEINQKLKTYCETFAPTDWYDDKGKPNMNYFQANSAKNGVYVDEIYVSDETSEEPVIKLIGRGQERSKLFQQYQDSKEDVSYLTWLENRSLHNLKVN